MVKIGKSTINSENIEVARQRWNRFSGKDKVITKIKLTKKSFPRKGNNLYTIFYKARQRK